mmetsp:Transcript_21651/g.60269  ORF Transcript_21651/g.60269 Transcript_21651/m.60269 type:complete len:138 (-) Transcript_21651:1190-1603(-)
MQSARRSLMRLHDLLQTLSTSLKDPWVYETLAYFNEQIGDDDAVLENLMKEYRSLQTVRGWEKDDYEVIKVSRVVKQIVAFQRQTPKDIAKSKFLVRGVVNSIKAARVDLPTHPTEISELESLLAELDEQGRQHQIN